MSPICVAIHLSAHMIILFYYSLFVSITGRPSSFFFYNYTIQIESLDDIALEWLSHFQVLQTDNWATLKDHPGPIV